LADPPGSLVNGARAEALSGSVHLNLSNEARASYARVTKRHSARGAKKARVRAAHNSREARRVHFSRRSVSRKPVSRNPVGLAVHRDGAEAQAANPVAALGSSLVAEARRWIGTNPTGMSRLWCARFMNFVLERTGRRGTSSDAARSFASYGRKVSGPQVGAIAVFSRGRNGGHVGVVSGTDGKGNPIVVSGNHGRRVAEAVYPKSRVLAYVTP
jgi:uncharacterized protein (TIGR02594 family)